MNTRFEISGQEVIDHQTGLIWQQAPETGLFTFDEAQTRAQEVAQQTGLHWRVPTIGELTSLVDWTLSDPASSFEGMPSTWFWSSSPYVGSSDYAWVVNFSYGIVYDSYRHHSLAVRLVRGG